ncbi:MAG: polysaccharide biosynthesis protein PelF [Thermotogaceae bacterium]|jgi:glycosyltransferase involved in cell wall biosynthesis|nr:polysaccharide biosynthesis protein PelF [Thermotogaceae bacterium]
MRVGLIVEGTYPYATGGVSSWVQTLIENMNDVEFEIYHLKPDIKEREILFELPENLKKISECTIFAENKWDLKVKTEPDFIRQVVGLIDFSNEMPTRAKKLFEILKDVAGKNVCEVLRTKTFWNAIVDVYERYFTNEGFSEYFWTVRNFILPFVNSFQFIPGKCDLYHSATTGYAALTGISGKIVNNSKLIITEHGIYHREREREIITSKGIPEKFKKMWISVFKLISALAYYSCDSLTTLFKKNQIFQLELGAEPSKMSIIPNGIDYDRFNVPRKAHSGFIVGFVGRVSRIKDLRTAIKAIRIVKNRIPETKFLIIGPYEEDEKDYYEECLQLVEILNLKDTVEFLGRQNVLDYYPTIDVLLLSSVSEGQPLVILEAMAAGIPVVSTDVGACREMLNDELGKSGYVVPPKDFDSLAKAIISLYEDRETYEKFSKNGKIVVSSKYRLDQMIRNYRNLYERVLNT